MQDSYRLKWGLPGPPLLSPLPVPEASPREAGLQAAGRHHQGPALPKGGSACLPTAPTPGWALTDSPPSHSCSPPKTTLRYQTAGVHVCPQTLGHTHQSWCPSQVCPWAPWTRVDMAVLT